MVAQPLTDYIRVGPDPVRFPRHAEAVMKILMALAEGLRILQQPGVMLARHEV